VRALEPIWGPGILPGNEEEAGSKEEALEGGLTVGELDPLQVEDGLAVGEDEGVEGEDLEHLERGDQGAPALQERFLGIMFFLLLLQCFCDRRNTW